MSCSDYFNLYFMLLWSSWYSEQSILWPSSREQYKSKKSIHLSSHRDKIQCKVFLFFFNHGNLQIYRNQVFLSFAVSIVACCPLITPFSRMCNGKSELYPSNLKTREWKKEVFIFYRDNIASRKKNGGLYKTIECIIQNFMVTKRKMGG